MGENENPFSATLPLSVSRIMSQHPSIFSGKIWPLHIPDVLEAEASSVNATDFLVEQFCNAAAGIALHAYNHPEEYAIETETAYNPEKDRVESHRRTFTSAAGYDLYRADVVAAAQLLCNGTDHYFELLNEAMRELAARGDQVDGSYEMLELKLLEYALQDSIGDSKLIEPPDPGGPQIS